MSGTTVSLLLFNFPESIIQQASDAFIFRDAASFSHSSQIYNVVPGDFTHDGTLDLLVMSRGSSPSEVKMELYLGSPGNGFGELCQIIFGITNRS